MLVRVNLQHVGMWLEWHSNKAIPSHVGYGYPSIYTGRQLWDNLRADLKKSAEKQGFQFTVHNTANSVHAMVRTLPCTLNRMCKNKACKQRGPIGINQPRKIEVSRPTWKEGKCPLTIKIPLNLKDNWIYLSKQWSVDDHCGHIRCSVIFVRADHIDNNVERMLKDFEVNDVKPSTASSMLHQICLRS
jgi:hypothetical protein